MMLNYTWRSTSYHRLQESSHLDSECPRAPQLSPVMNAASAPKQNYAFLTYAETLPSSKESFGDAPMPRVKHDASWSYSGPLLKPDAAALPANLHEWNAAALTDSLLPRLLPFLEFVNAFLASSGLDHYWLTIRATTPTPEYDQARWHTDDMFFARDSRVKRTTRPPPPSSPSSLFSSSSPSPPALDLATDWKLCTVLLGPPTLFIPVRHQAAARAREQRARRRAAALGEHPCTSLRCEGCASGAAAVRRELAAGLARFGAARAAAGQCVFFRIGPDRGAVHSEPPMGAAPAAAPGGRVFVNVVPGRRDELAALTRRWGMEFPRAWWTAPSLGRTYDGGGGGGGMSGGQPRVT